jgi:hypothetical protein
VLYGTADGLSAAGGTADMLDQFGTALAAGDFDGDGHDDLAIGLINDRVGDLRAGAVNVMHGDAETGLTSAGVFWSHRCGDGPDRPVRFALYTT